MGAVFVCEAQSSLHMGSTARPMEDCLITWLNDKATARKFFASIWSSILTAAAVFGGGIIFTQAIKNWWDLNVVGIGVGVGLLVIGWASTHIGKRMEAAAKNEALANVQGAERAALASFNDKMSASYPLLEKVIDPTTRKQNVEAFIQSVMASSVGLFQVDTIRSCLYILDGTVTSEDSDKPSALIYRTPQHGRSEQPRRSFERDTDHGKLLFDVLSTRVPLHIPDTTKSDHPIDSDDKHYRSFLAVSITSELEEFGVLTIDAAGIGDLHKEHEKTAQTLAALLAIGLKLSAPPAPRNVRAARSKP
jgi:hypothetical protein